MNEALTLLMAGVAGGGLGAIFFGGLWWTVRKGLSSDHPAFWFLGSMLLRTGIVLAGFYFVANRRLEPLAACLVGFIIARLLVTQMTRPAQESGNAH
jgi:F1F0 ATPase subunit 2